MYPSDLAREADESIKTAIEELELLRSQCQAMIDRIGLALTKFEIASGLAPRLPLKPHSPDSIVDLVANYYRLTVADVTGLSRVKACVRPRQVAMYLMRSQLGLSFPLIARAVGGRDHTTAVHACQRIQQLLTSDQELRDEVDELQRYLVDTK
ncbi:hypothetical protein KY386_03430 [Candidatus Parcubacteria bacterium]|nr:hypothetical protein [Candidatus Parcubacteria bacterium]